MSSCVYARRFTVSGPMPPPPPVPPQEPAAGSQPPPPNRHPHRVRFANVSVAEASGQKVPLTAKREASSVHTSKLYLTDEQRVVIQGLYQQEATVQQTYSLSETDQIAAAAFLAAASLDEDSQASLGSRWSVRHSRGSGKGVKATSRVLYQW